VRAAVLHASPGPLAVEELTVDAPGPHEVLVRTAAAGLCHSDLHAIDGKLPPATPTVLGHEAAGVVAEVGSDVTYVAPGDHVATCLSVFCGQCDFCLSGRPAMCESPGTERTAGDRPRLELGGSPCGAFAGIGGLAEELLVHERALVKILPEMPLDRAAVLGCAVTTGIGAVHHTARVEPGDTVAVIGCGGVGLNCVQGARLAGASRIVAVDTRASKLELARRFGATDVVDASAGDPVKEVRRLLPGGGVEHAFEAIGTKDTAEQAFKMLRRGGTATLIGIMAPGTTIELDGFSFLAERKVQGSNMGSNRFRQDMTRYVDLYLQGRLHLDELISDRLGLDEVNDGFARLGEGAVARAVVVFD